VTWVEIQGRAENNRVIQTRVDDLLVCLRSSGPVTFEEPGLGIAAIGPGGRVVIASRDLTTGRTQGLVMTSAGNDFQYDWRVDGVARPYGPEASEWRDAMLELLGGFWETRETRDAAVQLAAEATQAARAQQAQLQQLAEQLRASQVALSAALDSVMRDTLNVQLRELADAQRALQDVAQVRLREQSAALEQQRAAGELALLEARTTLERMRDRLQSRQLGIQDRLQLEAQIERLREIIRRLP
jgi:hypothetical protein